MENFIEAILLVGHGGIPKDAPKEELSELKRLESARQSKKIMQMSPREAELDKKIREWPRTQETDPYKWGLEDLAEKLRAQVNGKKVAVAYNEFCAPAVEDAIEKLVRDSGDARSSDLSLAYKASRQALMLLRQFFGAKKRIDASNNIDEMEQVERLKDNLEAFIRNMNIGA